MSCKNYFCCFASTSELIKATTEAVSLAVRRVMVACATLLDGDQPKLRIFHWPLGRFAGVILGISLMSCRSMARRVSVWQLTQSVLKKWLLAGSAMTSRICFVRSGEGGDGAKSSAVATPLRLAMGRLDGETAAFLHVTGLRLFVCGSGTTRGFVPTGSSICANC